MKQNLLSTPPAFKLYKDNSIFVGTILGGPLVAGYLAAENFKQIGEMEMVKKTWTIAIFSSILIFAGILFIPNIQKVPNFFLPLAYTMIAQYLVQTSQGAAIKTHVEKGGQTYSAWRAAWIGLIGLVITLAIIFLYVVLTKNKLIQ
jgi:hypothetical protein